MSKQKIEPLVNYFPAADFESSTPKSECSINVSRMKIAFSSALKIALNLVPGEKVLLAQDNMQTDIWYLVRHASGFLLKTCKSKKASYLLVHSRPFADLILESWQSDDGTPATTVVFTVDVDNPIMLPQDDKHIATVHYKLTMKKVIHAHPEPTPVPAGNAG